MIENFKIFINKEKELYLPFYNIINNENISLKDKQKLIDIEVNRILISNSNCIYTTTPKIGLICNSINLRIMYFKENNVQRVRSVVVKDLLNDVFACQLNLPLVLLSIVSKIFTGIEGNKISITNFSILLCKYLLDSLCISENNNKNFGLDTQIQLKIGIIFFEILNDTFVLNGETFNLFNNHKGFSISLTNDVKEILRVIPYFGNHHPLLIKPSNYSSTNYINRDRIFKFNMYHINCDCGLRKEYTTINDNVISTLNYLQSQPFSINKRVLKDVIENPFEYLLEFDHSKCILLPLKYKSFEIYLDSIEYSDLGLATESFYKGKCLLDLFIKTIIFADLYKHEIIYFNTYLDWRGRIYYNGYPLNPQSYKLCRRLLTLSSVDVMCSFDVTASGFQIIGLLTLDSFLLKMTNFQINNDNDIYEYIMNKYKDFIHKELNIDEYPFLLNDEFNKLIFNRKFIKNLSMCLIYTEGDFSRANKIDEVLINTSVKICKKDLMKLAALFKKCVYEAIPSINNIAKKFYYLLNEIRNNKVIYLESSKKHISTVYSYPKQEIKRVIVTKYSKIGCVSNNVMKEKKNIYLNVVPYKNDILKLRRSLFPNFIHQVDSLILHKVVQNAMQKNISLYTIHDCFVSDIKNKSILNEIYLNACIDVIINDKPLQNLFEKNNYELIKTFNTTLENVLISEKNNKNILKEEIYDIINN